MSLCQRKKVRSGLDFRDGDAGSAEILWATVVERVSNEGRNFENDALVNGKPKKLMWSNFLVFVISLAAAL